VGKSADTGPLCGVLCDASVGVDGGLDDILEAFSGLMEARDDEEEAPAEGTGNFRCEHCVACHDCRFCTECDNCRECTYCYGCRDSLSLTQCRSCDASEKLTHSDLCAESINSSYLTLCLDCEDCVQCFGCVGLRGEEFCILNEKHERKVYFAKVKELRAELDRRVREGWQPPWRDPVDEAEPEQTEPEQTEPEEPAPRSEPVVEPPPVPTQRDQPVQIETMPVEPTARDKITRELPRIDALPDDDSGIWARQLFEDIPPPPPYSPRESSRPEPRREPDESPTRLYAPLDEQPTLTRGTRPFPRAKSKPGTSKPARVSLRRAKRPTRD